MQEKLFQTKLQLREKNVKVEKKKQVAIEALMGVIDHCKCTNGGIRSATMVAENNMLIDICKMDLKLLYKIQHFINEFDATNNPDFGSELIENAIKDKSNNDQKCNAKKFDAYECLAGSQS